jgi:hypothetical protein
MGEGEFFLSLKLIILGPLKDPITSGKVLVYEKGTQVDPRKHKENVEKCNVHHQN